MRIFTSDICILSPEENKLFWTYVNKTKDCWLWTGGKTSGYGSFGLTREIDGVMKSRGFRAHRLAYINLVGPVRTQDSLDHLCRVRACVNPKHLEPVSNKVNILRGKGPTACNALKTHCKNGHPLAGSNLIRIKANGQRRCRICVNAQNRGYRKFTDKRTTATAFRKIFNEHAEMLNLIKRMVPWFIPNENAPDCKVTAFEPVDLIAKVEAK